MSGRSHMLHLDANRLAKCGGQVDLRTSLYVLLAPDRARLCQRVLRLVSLTDQGMLAAYNLTPEMQDTQRSATADADCKARFHDLHLA